MLLTRVLELKYKQMSIASYKRNEKRGVTGPYKPTCFPASLEQLSPYGLPPKAYTEYLDFIGWYFSIRGRDERDKHNPEYKEMFDNLVVHLGGLSCKDVIFRRANTSLGLVRIVKDLVRQDYQVAIDVRMQGKGIHTVGLLPTGEEDYYTLVSNQIPQSLQGIVKLQDIAPRLSLHGEKYMKEYPFSNANITALPPAA